MAELKPCPFCDSTETKKIWPKHLGGMAYRCKNCNAQGPYCVGDENDTANSYARQAWNRRAK